MVPMSKRMQASVYSDRIARAASAVRERGLAGIIIGTGPQLAYLTGSWLSSHERLTALTITAAGEAVIVAPETDVASFADSAVGELDITVRGWADGEDAHQLAAAPILAAGAAETAPVGLGDSLTTRHVLALQELLAPRPTVVAALTLAELFTRKDEEEIGELRRAGEAIDRVHARVPALLVAGRTENAVAKDIENLILSEHEAVDFIIVGSGENGANPHHSHSDRVLQQGELVVVDIGGTLDTGYRSDCTRTYVVGGPSQDIDDEVESMYQVLYRAQQAAVDAVRPGVTAESIDRAAREPIAWAGYGDAFFHRTGHGIGLSTHEEPFIMGGNDLVLEEGMAFSIEPGIYLRGRYGARIEDIVVVTADGCEQLNRGPRELQ
ncbi:M24 family metallopeptidase [Corynebacterium atypicum]